MPSQKDGYASEKIFGSLEEGFLRADLDDYIIMANEAISRMCGYSSPEEMIGLHMNDLLVHPHERGHIVSVMKSKGKLLDIEIALRRKDGTCFWSLSNIIIFRDEKGAVQGTEGVVRDITKIRETIEKFQAANQQLAVSEEELKAANQQLAASEEELKAANQQLKAANQQLAASKEELKAANQQLAAREEELKAANQQLAAREEELKAANQQLIASEHQLLAHQAELRRNLESLQLGEQIANLGYFERNWQTGLGFWSKGFYSLLGVSTQAIDCTHEDFLSYVHPDDRQRVSKHIKATLIEQSGMDIEFRIIQDNNNILSIHGIGINIYDEAGRPLKTLGTFQNITERKKEERKTIAKSTISQILLHREENELYTEILDAVLQITESKHGVFGHINSAGDLVCPSLTKDIWDECNVTDKSIVFPQSMWGDSIWGNGLRSKKGAYSNEPFRVPSGHLPVERFLTIPLVYQNESVGLISVGNKPSDYTDEDFDLLQEIADYLAPVIAMQHQRKQLAESIAEKNRRFEEAQEMGKIGNYEYDLINNKYYVSNEAKRIYGYSIEIEEFSPDDVWKCIPDTKRVQQAWVDLIEKDMPYNLEHEIRPVSGPKSKIIKAIGEVIRDKSGNPIKVVGLIQDITERKQAGEDLRRTELLLRSSIEGSVNMIMLSLDKNYCYLYYNKAHRDTMLSSYGREPRIGECIFDFMTNEDDIQKIKYGYDKALKGESTVTTEIYGEIDKKYFNIHINPITDENSDVVGISIFSEDVTERILAEQAVKVVNSKLEQTEIMAKIGGWSIDMNTLGTYLSTGVKRIYEIDSNEVLPIEKGIRYYVPEDRTIIENAVQECMQTGKPYDLELRLITAKGNLRWVRTGGSATMENDRIMQLTGYLQDITEQKVFEESLLAAKEKAEESDRLKMAFLQNMSHEIRTPMNGILGFLSLLEEPDLDDVDKNDYIKLVNQSGARLLDTINDLIEISKIESRAFTQSCDIVHIDEMMQYQLDFFTPQAGVKKLSLSIPEQVVGEEAVIETDRCKLESILTNLLKNAVKFTSQGSIEFGNIRESDVLIFYVRDTGEGIPADRIDAVFDRFVQAEKKVNRSYEGSGLGLSIVKSHVEALGGSIKVVSAVDQGSEFIFTIPYVPSSAPAHDIH